MTIKRKKLPPEALNGHKKKVGGKRNGAGRKHGSVNKQSQRMAELAEESGMVLGHMFMLEVLNAGIKKEMYKGKYKVTWADMKWAAERCANYFAPKLQATQVTGTHTNTVLTLTAEQLSKLTTEELAVAEKLLGKLGLPQEDAKPDAAAAALYAATLTGTVH